MKKIFLLLSLIIFSSYFVSATVLAEGQAVRINACGDASYNVAITFISTSEVILNVNNQNTDSLSEGDVYELPNGNYLRVNDILARDVQGTLSKVDFTIAPFAENQLVEEGETTMVNLCGTNYAVSITFISTSEVILNINGENTNVLSEGDIYQLPNGNYLRVNDILPRNVSGALGRVAFTIGFSNNVPSAETQQETTGEERTDGADTEENQPQEQETEEENQLNCSGCQIESQCYPLGYRKESNYCSDNGNFISQKRADLSCENNFECQSNVCVSGQCVSQSLISKILSWFKSFFS